MPEIYAEDLIKLEESLTSLEKERAALGAASPLMRRLKKDRIDALDRQIYDLSMQIVSAKEHVFSNPTSSALYEQMKTRERAKAIEKDKELAREREIGD